MAGYEITCSITALCPSCGKELPSGSYLTEAKSTGNPFERDNPYERTARRVFITPCTDCWDHKSRVTALADALEKLMELERRNRVMPIGREWDAARAALALARGEA